MGGCIYCNRDINNTGSLTAHQKQCLNNPNRVPQISSRGMLGKKAWNSGKTKETDARIRGGVNAYQKSIENGTYTPHHRTHDQRTKKQISNSMMGNKNATHRGDRQSFYKDVRMDSRWEVATAKYLDEQNISWKYSERGFVLSDGRYYYPDFFIYNNNVFEKLIEVKGFFREANRLKFEQFQREYPDIVVELWEKSALVERNIITKSGVPKYVIDAAPPKVPKVRQPRIRKPRAPRIYIKRIRKPKREWPELEVLHKMVLKFGYEIVGKSMGISGNAVKKHLQRHGVFLPQYNTQHTLYHRPIV